MTAASISDKPWIADQKFIMSVKTIVRDYNNSLVLVTHPTKAPKTKGPGQISGGAAYMRFSQAALWLGTTEGTPNREMHIIKARNGRGSGACIGFQFSGTTLRFTEHGVVGGAEPPEPVRAMRQPISPNPSPDEDLFG